jgi:hypothetical protein
MDFVIGKPIDIAINYIKQHNFIPFVFEKNDKPIHKKSYSEFNDLWNKNRYYLFIKNGLVIRVTKN